MKDLSCHIMDIIQNSIRAGASLIEINVLDSHSNNRFSFSIRDNGCGMDPAMLSKAVDPFFTSRETRKVGLGLSLLKQNAEMAQGSFELRSELGKGTELDVSFCLSHPDCQPMGPLGETIALAISGNPLVDFYFSFRTDQDQFEFDTQTIKEELNGLSVSEPAVYSFLKTWINEQIGLIMMQNACKNVYNN
jgi:hypothetical protein